MIQEVGPWPETAARNGGVSVLDLGEVTLMPGLVNAHCHLDYTGMAGLIPPPASFPDWIKAILPLKANWSYSEYAESWVKGARQLLDSGCTTVGDIEAVPELLPDAWNATPMRVLSFLEMTGVRSGHEPGRILREALSHERRLPVSHLHRTGLAPHALYSTPPALLELIGAAMREHRFSAAIHLAESQAEWDMYKNRSGPLYDWLKSQRPMDDCGGRSPVQQAFRLGLLQPQLLAIHCNCLAPGDADLLAHAGCRVVHCPGSHEYFNHPPFLFQELAAAGVEVALGTDSLASARLEKGRPPTLDLWEEMRTFARKNPGVRPETIIRMGTIHGAAALGVQAGAIEPGLSADLIAVDYAGPDPMGGLLFSQARIAARYIRGGLAGNAA